MNAKLLSRLIESISVGDHDSLKQIAETIIEEEKKNGHKRLAKDLEDIFNSNKPTLNAARPSNDSIISGGLTTLPVSRRYNQTLATMIPRDKLKHHMILCPDLEKRFDQIEKEYAARERLKKHNLRPRTKILLYGPPGCGKTLGAERLAWNLGLPLMKVKFDAIISSYFGESSANLRAIFESSMEQPCVLLLDECDFIAKSRTIGKDVGEIPRIVNMLLMLLDEYAAPGLLVATTNLEDALDKALFRRFDEVIEITRPTDKEILPLFKLTLSSFNVDKSVNWDMLVEKVKGFSAANIVTIAENAAKLSVLDGSGIVNQEYIERSIGEIKDY
ncbi:AAA family ATPase [Desulfitobacterium sp. AusDCA]|uniref:AAA family ATPase n=1 Tax=Desulfitobacterium sp. AusDCA TaxID=3240383 RepID=UPI003DA70EE1